MKKTLHILLFLFLTGCVYHPSTYTCDDIELIEHGPNELEIRFCKWFWGGFIGSHGFNGYISASYNAALVGKGPKYVNPLFLGSDDPYSPCVGEIYLDRERNLIVVNMRRVISEKGNPEKTIAHPANGKHIIKSVRKSQSEERQAFEKWLNRVRN